MELRVLGMQELLADDGSSRLSVLAQPKRFALLVYLALNSPRGFTRRDSIVAMFWPELDQEHARNALSQAIRFLRRELGENVILRRGEDSIAVNQSAIQLDAAEFATACDNGDYDRALGLYHGPLLDGVFIGDAPDFERWLDTERAQFSQRYAHALETVAESSSSQGNLVAAVDAWRRRAALEPLNSSIALQLMLALAAQGDRAGAIAHAREHEKHLADELGAEPDRSVSALAEELLSSSSSPAPNGELLRNRINASDQQTVGIAGTAHPSREAARSRLGLIGLGLGAALVIGLIAATRRPSTSASAGNRANVAVLALQNETGRADLDFVGLEVQDWVTRGLQETGLARVFAAAPDGSTGGASTLVGGRYYLRGDTILIQVSVLAAADRKVIAAPKIVAASVRDPTQAIDTLRQRIIGALAAYLDPALTEWSTFASQPPSFDAYREFSLGQKAFNRDDYKESVAHWLRAAALDTTYVYPLLMAAGIRGEIQTDEFPTTDSIMRLVRAHHQRLAPFDEALASEIEASTTGNFERRLDAAQELRKYVAPGSTWDLDAVNTAIALNRPDEAMKIVQGVDLHREAALDHWSVFIDIGNAYHLAGKNSELLEMLRKEVPEKWQNGPLFVAFKILARAALSRPGEVDSVWRLTLRRSDGEGRAGAMWTAVQGAMELRAHGQPDAARKLAQAGLDSITDLPATSNKFGNPVLWKMHALRLSGHEREALPIARELLSKKPNNFGLLIVNAHLATQLGDTATARSIDARLAAWKGTTEDLRLAQLARARVAAVLGKRDSAVTLLHVVCDHGCWGMEDIHMMPEFNGLLSFRPFLDFLRPRH